MAQQLPAKMTEDTSSRGMRVTSSCPPLPKAGECTDFAEFLDASNSRVAWLINRGQDCLQSEGDSAQSSFSDDYSSSGGVSVKEGGVSLTAKDPDDSSSDGGHRLSRSHLNELQSLSSSNTSSIDDPFEDTTSNIHTAPSSSPTSNLSAPTNNNISFSSGYPASSESSSDSGSWASGNRSWSSFDELAGALRRSLRRCLSRVHPPPLLYQVPSLTSDATSSASSSVTDSNASEPVVIEYLPLLPVDADDELFFDMEPFFVGPDNNTDEAISDDEEEADSVS